MDQLSAQQQPALYKARSNRPRFPVRWFTPLLKLCESWVMVFAAAFGLALGLVWVVVALALFLMRPLP